MNMITFVVEQDQCISNPHFSLKNLQEFSKQHHVKIVIRKFCIMINGVVTWLV